MPAGANSLPAAGQPSSGTKERRQCRTEELYSGMTEEQVTAGCNHTGNLCSHCRPPEDPTVSLQSPRKGAQTWPFGGTGLAPPLPSLPAWPILTSPGIRVTQSFKKSNNFLLPNSSQGPVPKHIQMGSTGKEKQPVPSNLLPQTKWGLA